MREKQKKKILEIIKTLQEAHGKIEEYIGINEIQLAKKILNECQECAITIGNTIEKIEGKESIIISYLEEYCDILFYIYEELSNNSCNLNKMFTDLRRCMLKIEDGVSKVKVKKEIVFFPYKASMWDAMESIYLTAKEYPNCDVYCVPIPYFDKNADGSLGNMNYEGNEYPNNVEITDWTTYNFEERKPDIIFVHNPYDDLNRVTCVHPRFFSSNLKNYTDKLVYVPYFVLNEIMIDDQTKIDQMKHFIIQPGVINADKVIVQSKNMETIYKNELSKAIKIARLNGKYNNEDYLEKKIIGMGAPQFDKIVNSKREDFTIPNEWQQLIGGREIILYNTSIGTFLKYRKEYLNKLHDILQFFKNRNDVVLWWRPHPLFKSTIESMVPELSELYNNMVSEYTNEKYGIYDDTSDLNRAIICTDRYYGDYSSVMILYGATGKSVLMSCIEQRKRVNYEIDSWKTEDIEKEDLARWIDTKETWKINRTFKEIYGDCFLNGDNGSRILKYCVEEE